MPGILTFIDKNIEQLIFYLFLLSFGRAKMNESIIEKIIVSRFENRNYYQNWNLKWFLNVFLFFILNKRENISVPINESEKKKPDNKVEWWKNNFKLLTLSKSPLHLIVASIL